MKKIFKLLFIVFMLAILSNKEETMLVNNEIEDDEMVTVLLTVPGLNTNNFTNYFDDSIEIVGIYPKVNLLYKKKIGDMYYAFNGSSVKQNINNFSKHYKNVLKKNSFNEDLTRINYNGISIEKVIVYVNDELLQNFIHRCKSCEYEKTSQS